MNALALLAVLFGTAAIILLYALLAARDEAAGWRIYARHLQGQAGKPTVIGTVSPSPALQAAAPDLIAECELLERRNDWLESQRDHCKDVVAGSMAQVRIPRRDKRMEVRETQEAP